MKFYVTYSVGTGDHQKGPYSARDAAFHFKDISTFDRVYNARIIAADMDAHLLCLAQGHYGPTDPEEGKITVGCWVQTQWGRAVCCYVGKDRFIGYRYPAHPFKDGKVDPLRLMWVANGDKAAEGPEAPKREVRYLGPPDDESRAVVRLGGPYGASEVCLEEPSVW